MNNSHVSVPVSHRGLPPTAVLEITRRCNLACRFCYAPWIDHPEAFGDEIPISRWHEIVDYLVAGGVTRVEVTGGEPLLKDGALDLLRRLKDRQELKELSLYSNLYAFTDEALAVVDDPRFTVCTSFQGLSNLHKIAGCNCDRKKWRYWCRRIARSDAKLSVNVVVCKQNVDELEAMLAEADSFGATSIGIGPVLIEGRAKIHPELWLTFDETERLYARLDSLSQTMATRLEIARERFCKCRPDCMKPVGTPDGFSQPDCHVEVGCLTVGPDGHFRRCLHTWDVSRRPVDWSTVTREARPYRHQF